MSDDQFHRDQMASAQRDYEAAPEVPEEPVTPPVEPANHHLRNALAIIESVLDERTPPSLGCGCRHCRFERALQDAKKRIEAALEQIEKPEPSAKNTVFHAGYRHEPPEAG